jgi:catechol 2,3-dioxygenase-like lactoylglutathione lyase family enzyme
MKAGLAIGIDHVGIVVRDLAQASAAWAAIGFAPVAGRIMLRQGYIELLADDPARPSATLARFLAQGEGAHVLTLRVADAAAASARLVHAGLRADLLAADRPADPAQPDGPRARFLRLPLTDQDPRLQLLQHQTPELVWQERFMAQHNGATALEGVTIATATPATMAARLSRIAGRPVIPAASGGYLLPLPQGEVWVVPGDGPPRITQLTLRAPVAHATAISGVALALRR